MSTTSVELTDVEMRLLDGACSEGVQLKVDAAIARLRAREQLPGLTGPQADLIADVVAHAQKDGVITWSGRRLRQCRVCGKECTYPRHSRRSRYHRRGDVDYSHPIYLGGIEMADSFIIVTGSVRLGACTGCVTELIPHLRKALSGLRAQLPVELLSDGAPIWHRYGNKRCKKCGWTGHEGQLGKLPTLMGDGYYRGKCPQCGEENGLLYTPIESVDGFQIVEEPQ